MRGKNPFSELTTFEKILWISSLAVILITFFAFGGKGLLSLAASLVGATALIFLAKGYVIGQLLIVLFSLMYAVISIDMKYYGEMITYLCMTSPMAMWAAFEWLKNPYEKGRGEVKVGRLTAVKLMIMAGSAIGITWAFYYILKLLGTGSLLLSTASVATSFVACVLTLYRSPYYALGYAANDIVLVVLWIIATVANVSYAPMVACFLIFLLNDLYGFYNWKRMQKKQA